MFRIVENGYESFKLHKLKYQLSKIDLIATTNIPEIIIATFLL